jgi:hypothetical protein
MQLAHISGERGAFLKGPRELLPSFECGLVKAISPSGQEVGRDSMSVAISSQTLNLSIVGAQIYGAIQLWYLSRFSAMRMGLRLLNAHTDLIERSTSPADILDVTNGA